MPESPRAYHVPVGSPLCMCGVPAARHRVDHVPQGDPCTLCHLPARNHRIRVRPAHHPKGDPCFVCGETAERHREQVRPKERTSLPVHYIGIDGEGIDVYRNGKTYHQYNLMGAALWNGSGDWFVEPEKGKTRLTTKQCLDFILDLPGHRYKIFSFSFNYDLTKMLTDIDNESLFMLFRPHLRPRPPCEQLKGPYPVAWPSNSENPYLLNYQGTKFSVQRNGVRRVVWDLFKFFQGKFLTAIKDWKVGTAELWDRIETMKVKRSSFKDEKREDIIRYCLEECVCIGQLAEKLINAHKDAGLKLRAYYGAGSSGGAMLTAMGVKSKIVPTPEDMRHAVACAFSGGRFENSVIGAFREPLTNFDISSAYPYAQTFLPCLEHAVWERTRDRKHLEAAENQYGALVRYSFRRAPSEKQYQYWGPFPYREKDGTISYPLTSGGGWVWLQEFLQGERLFPHVKFEEAFVYKSNCGCKPFNQLPEYYNLRLKVGKEGAGLAIKLGMNSCYGKLAQSVGNAQFNSWIWAGMITSSTRAQLLQLLGLHRDRSDVLMMATDGLVTRDSSIVPPDPIATGTGHTGKPLGGWERKPAQRGMFIARPGIYFPIDPTEDELTSIRARGVGRSVIFQSWRRIIDTWEHSGVKKCRCGHNEWAPLKNTFRCINCEAQKQEVYAVAQVANVRVFCGAKTSVSYNPKRGFVRARKRPGKAEDHDLPAYGEWVRRSVELSFDPMPKRSHVLADGKTLALRSFDQSTPSVPYDRAVHRNSPDAIALKKFTEQMEEQPDPEYMTDFID